MDKGLDDDLGVLQTLLLALFFLGDLLHSLAAGDGEVGRRQDFVVEVFEVLHPLGVEDADNREQVAEDANLLLAYFGEVDVEMILFGHVDGQDADLVFARLKPPPGN